MSPLRLSFAALAAALAMSTPAAAQVGMLSHSVWFQRTQDMLPDKKVYRRYSVKPDGDMPNTELYHCPKDSSTYTHVSFEMKKVRDLSGDFPNGFAKMDARVLIEGKNALTFPAEVIKSEIFIDRTPKTAVDFDRMVDAREVVLLFDDNSTVKFVRAPELSTKMPEFFKMAGVGPMKAFTSDEVARDCARYRAGR